MGVLCQDYQICISNQIARWLFNHHGQQWTWNHMGNIYGNITQLWEDINVCLCTMSGTYFLINVAWHCVTGSDNNHITSNFKAKLQTIYAYISIYNTTKNEKILT